MCEYVVMQLNMKTECTFESNKLKETKKIMPVFIIIWCLYSKMENARGSGESESSEARMGRMERTLAALTETLAQQ